MHPIKINPQPTGKKMFSQLSQRLTDSVNKLRGIRHLTEDNIKETLNEVRKALIEADVALPAIKEFIEHVREKAIGQTVVKKTQPGETLIKLVNDELIQVLGNEQAELNLNAPSPIVILVAGLQGSGKTTSVAKLAYWLHHTKKKSVMLASADIYRPAAIDQLETLSTQVSAKFFPTSKNQSPVDIVQEAMSQAKKQLIDVLIIDTAGRLHINEQLMEEIKQINKVSSPTEVLLVVDSMAGQDAANIAKSFSEALPLTGVILTKTDGDARGGAALSMRIVAGKPIKFVGVGEKVDALELFYPERVASRILGMGDIVSLVEEAQQKIDKAEAEKMAKKIKKGGRFDFNDFLTQLQQMKKMGGMQSLLSKLPGMPQTGKLTQMLDDKLFVKMEAIIQSMTEKERQFPALVNGSRKNRISKGSGTTLQDINKMLKQFEQMQKMLKRFQGNKMMKRMKALQGQLPPDLLGKLPTDWE